MKELVSGAGSFVNALQAEGVTHVFGVPGEETLDLTEALRTSGIRLVVTRHEAGAGFMAATWGRLTGRAGVALSTLGPGATNLVTAAAYAQLGAMPMVMVTGQKPIRARAQGRFQLVDVVQTMKALTKTATSLPSADAVPARVRDAFRLAEEERPGAALLELPEDVARERTAAKTLPRARAARPIADEPSVARAIDAIESARRPIFVIGAGANRKATSPMLRALVEKTGIPFVTTQMGKGVLDETSPAWAGTTARSSGDRVHAAIDAADVVVTFGHDVVEKPPFVAEKERVLVHVGFSSAAVESVYAPTMEVVGDIGNAASRLFEGITVRDHWDFSAARAARAALDAGIAAGASDDRFPLHPGRIVAEVRAALPASGIACLDNGMYKLWFARGYPCTRPSSLLLDNALATMGAGLPSAIAAKLVAPERPVVAVVGDGGLMMSLGELETAVRLGVHVVVIVIRDDGYGMIKWKQEEMGLPSFAMDLGNPDFPKLAEAFGARGHAVRAASELGPTLERALASDGVHVVDVPVDYATWEAS